MTESYRHILVERHGHVAFVRLAKLRLEEPEIYQMFREVLQLGREPFNLFCQTRAVGLFGRQKNILDTGSVNLILIARK